MATESVPSEKKKKGFSFPLPLDPARLLASVAARWPWILFGVLLFGGIGLAVGAYMNHPSYTITVSLIKRKVPQTVRISEDGQSYRPGDLNDATLLATLHTTEPLDRTLERMKNGLSANEVMGLIEASQQKGTDIFFLTYHSPVSPGDAVKFSSIWAEEINNYTQRLQQAEARAVREILQKEVATLEKHLAGINMQLLEFSKQHEFFGGDSQISAALITVKELEIKLQEARVSHAARIEKLETMADQLRRQSPLEFQLKQAREQLSELRATYTDVNPLVQAKIQNIEYMEGQVKQLAEQKESNLEVYTGTPLGNQLYLNIVTLRNEQLELTKQIQSYETLYKAALARLHEFPALVAGYDALLKERESILGGISLMGNRLKEAEIFASSAPGYWQIFQPADGRAIKYGSMLKKPLLLGSAGAIVGATLAVMLSLLLTQRTSRRSVLECCLATHAPLLAILPIVNEDAAFENSVSWLWLTTLAPLMSRHSRVLFWCPGLSPKLEKRFWQALAKATSEDGVKRLYVQDLTPDDLWKSADHPESLMWSHDTVEDVQTLLRASSLPSAEPRKVFQEVEFWVAMVVGERSSLSEIHNWSEITAAYLPPCDGTVAFITRPKGDIRRLGDIASAFLTRRFS